MHPTTSKQTANTGTVSNYFIQSNDGRFVVLDVYPRNYRLVKDSAKRGLYATNDLARMAMEDAWKQLHKRSKILALAIFQTR